MINIAVIGRQLGSEKWSTLFELLEQGKEAEYWKYESFDVDKLDRGHFKSQEFDRHILVGTKPIDETPNIRFYSTASEEDIIDKMQALADSVYEEDNGNSNSNGDAPVVCTPDNEPSEVDNSSSSDSASAEGVSSIGGSLTDWTDSSSTKEERVFDSLIGMQVEIDGKTIFLDYSSALELKDMLSIMKEYGYRVKNVITGNTSGDD